MGIRQASLIFALVSSLLVAAMVAAFVSFQRDTLREIDTLHHRSTQIDRLAGDTLFYFKKQVQEWKDVLLRGHDPREFAIHWQRFEEEERNTRERATQLAAALEDLPDYRAKMQRFIADHAAMGARYRAALRLYDIADPRAAFKIDNSVRGIDRDPTRFMDDLADEVGSYMEIAHERQEAAAGKRLTTMAIGGSTIVFVWLALCAWLLSRWILKPLSSATTSARKIGAGDYDTAIPEDNPGEVGTFLRALAAMQQRIRHDTAILEQQHKEIQESYRQAQAADAAKSRFLSIISHELRTPLNGIDGARQLLAAERHTAEQREMFNIIEQSSTQLTHLIDRILLYVELDRDRRDMPQEVIPDSAQWLHALAAAFQQRARAKGLLLVEIFDFPAALALAAPSRMLGVAIQEVLDNAIKFSQRGTVLLRGHLDRSDPAQTMLTIVVEDQGDGIAIAEAAKPFTQGDESSKRAHGGLGLGLALCQRIMDVVHGGLILDSTPGAGTRAHMEIPVAAFTAKTEGAFMLAG